MRINKKMLKKSVYLVVLLLFAQYVIGPIMTFFLFHQPLVFKLPSKEMFLLFLLLLVIDYFLNLWKKQRTQKK